MASRVLARAAWVPDIGAALAVQAALPPGWIAVPRDGGAVVSELAATLGAGESVLERRAEAGRLAAETERIEADLASLRVIASNAAEAATGARAALETVRGEEARVAAARREAEEAERLAARDLEGLSPRDGLGIGAGGAPGPGTRTGHGRAGRVRGRRHRTGWSAGDCRR